MAQGKKTEILMIHFGVRSFYKLIAHFKVDGRVKWVTKSTEEIQ